MNAPKFTPGLWRSVPTTTHGIDLVTIRRDIVSDGAEFLPAFVAGDITPEDADLIAAAPELYEALEDLRALTSSHDFKAYYTKQSAIQTIGNVHARCVAALAKVVRP